MGLMSEREHTFPAVLLHIAGGLFFFVWWIIQRLALMPPSLSLCGKCVFLSLKWIFHLRSSASYLRAYGPNSFQLVSSVAPVQSFRYYRRRPLQYIPLQRTIINGISQVGFDNFYIRNGYSLLIIISVVYIKMNAGFWILFWLIEDQFHSRFSNLKVLEKRIQISSRCIVVIYARQRYV